MERKEIEAEFYRECGRLLGVQATYQDANPITYWSPRHEALVRSPTKAGRFVNRGPGNGRYAGRGTIRMFNPGLIHVALTTPAVNRVFTSPEAVLQFLENVRDNHT